ncbi:MAG: DJ-1/PfpI family protein [Armatimonadota bacterium]
MRRHQPMLSFVRAMHEAGKPVAFICHAGWVPISAGIVRGRTVTSILPRADRAAGPRQSELSGTSALPFRASGS